ncbi:MFS transporter [Nonomuraea polychroma]|uniref:MFS transporter n=1 Tax=Nonomuraea polychroma TaxID=46176 RepID=UPI00240D7C01|nr:MFS transporter [Nonomuraea polychroma]
MVIQAQSAPAQVDTRRVGAAVAAAGLSSFALLYAPQPVLPQLAAAFRLDPGSASLAIGVATGALAVAVLPVAALAETVGRRRMIVWSVVVSAVLGLLLPLAPSFPVLLVMRAVQGVAIAGFAGVAAAYLADQVGPGRLAGAVGAMIAGNSVGGMTGRLGTGFAAGPLGWHGALAVVAGVALACALFAALTLPRTPSPQHAPSPAHAPAPGAARVPARGSAPGRAPVPVPAHDPASSGEPADGAHVERGRRAHSRAAHVRPDATWAGRPRTDSTRAGRRGAGVGVLVPCMVGALATGAFVALYNAAGFRLAGEPLSLSPAVASLVFLSYAMGTASSAAAGRLAARLGRTTALVTSLIVTVAGSALTLHPSLPAMSLGFALLTAGFFAAHAIANAWVAAQASPQARGRAAGLYTLCFYLGSGAGGTAGTIVYGHAGWSWLIALTSAWLLLATLAVLLRARRDPAG